MKTSDIPEEPILKFLAKHQGKWATHGTGYSMPTVQDAMPPGTLRKLQLSKMKSMVKKGLVSGCACGCRGDWEIKDKGLALIEGKRTTHRIGAGSDWDDARAGKREIDSPPSSSDNMINMIMPETTPKQKGSEPPCMFGQTHKYRKLSADEYKVVRANHVVESYQQAMVCVHCSQLKLEWIDLRMTLENDPKED